LIHGPQAQEEIEDLLTQLGAAGATVTYLRADFRDLRQVRELAARVGDRADRIDLLINNAGIAGPPRWTASTDGNELTLQVNYLAPTVLTGLLLSRMPADLPARIVNVASATHYSATLRLDDLNMRRGYDPIAAYARSKLALVTYSCWLAAELGDGPRTVVSVHPGVISTGLLHRMFALEGAAVERGAANIVHAATTTGQGIYFDEGVAATPHADALDPRIQGQLHQVTLDLVGDP
jgi:NAD(P)-dependent dehydrogenase (short-subunit alcohol dehydrogenase family)